MVLKKAVAAAMLIMACLVLLFVLVKPRAPFLLPPLPNPNGYDDFLKASQLVIEGKPYADMTEDELRADVAANTDALRLVREGLRKQCGVPIEFSTNFLNTHMPDLARMKGLGLKLRAEGNFAKSEHRTNDAASAYLDIVRFSHKSTRGGLMIDRLVGFALENIGVTELQKLIPDLSAPICRDLQQSLEEIDSAAEDISLVEERDLVWGRRTMTPGGYFSLGRLLLHARTVQLLKPARQKFEKKSHNLDSRRHDLIVDFAVHTFELEKGHPPATLTELVPTCLRTIPTTGTNTAGSFPR